MGATRRHSTRGFTHNDKATIVKSLRNSGPCPRKERANYRKSMENLYKRQKIYTIRASHSQRCMRAKGSRTKEDASHVRTATSSSISSLPLSVTSIVQCPFIDSSKKKALPQHAAIKSSPCKTAAVCSAAIWRLEADVKGGQHKRANCVLFLTLSRPMPNWWYTAGPRAASQLPRSARAHTRLAQNILSGCQNTRPYDSYRHPHILNASVKDYALQHPLLWTLCPTCPLPIVFYFRILVWVPIQ